MYALKHRAPQVRARGSQLGACPVWRRGLYAATALDQDGRREGQAGRRHPGRRPDHLRGRRTSVQEVTQESCCVICRRGPGGRSSSTGRAAACVSFGADGGVSLNDAASFAPGASLIAGRGIRVGPARIAVSERYRPGGRGRRARRIRRYLSVVGRSDADSSWTLRRSPRRTSWYATATTPITTTSPTGTKVGASSAYVT